MGTDRRSELEIQWRRITHIQAQSGITPKVLDLSPFAFYRLVDEIMAESNPKTDQDKQDLRDQIDRNLMVCGVRIIKGRI
jgi:Tfp pilus assembly PilM family ATPase